VIAGQVRAWALVTGGTLLSLAGAALHADLLGLTDFVFVDAGHLAFRLPIAGVVHTPLALQGSHEAVRRAAPFALATGGALAIGVLWLARQRARVAMRAWPRGGQGAVALLLAACTLAAFVPVGDRGGALAVYFVIAVAGFALLLLGLPSTGAGTDFGRAVAGAGARFLQPERSDGRLALALALAALTASTTIALGVFAGAPHVVDGVSQLFQARIFATGRLFVPSPPLTEFFDIDTVVNNGKWFSQYTPGHAAFLMIGDAAGASWLVNPLFGAGTVAVVYRLGVAAHGAEVGRVAALLLVLSPFFLLMSAEFYSHASAFFFLTLFLFFYVRNHDDPRPIRALGIGACLGLAVMSRPLTSLAFALPVAVHGASGSLAARDLRKLRSYALAGVATLALVCLLFLYNRLTTGSALVFGYGQAAGPGLPFEDGVQWTRSLARVIALNDDLLGWPVPALFLPLLAFLGGKPTAWDYLWVAIFLTLLGVHATTSYPDTEFGPRYLYEASGPLLLLSARGLVALRLSVERLIGRPVEPAGARTRAGVALGVALVLALGLSLPTRLAYYASPGWRWARPEAAVERVRREPLSDALVFVRGERLWEALFLDNPLAITEASVVYARDLGDRDAELAALFPGRRYFIADSVSIRSVELP